jgi:uncharacterized membrane protein YbaN (DUF454 family)
LKTIIALAAGIFLTILGAIGLLVPILPGFLFLLPAAVCFASVSPTLRNRMGQHPRIGRFLHRMDSSRSLDTPGRIKLAFWAGLEAVNPRQRSDGRLKW